MGSIMCRDNRPLAAKFVELDSHTCQGSDAIGRNHARMHQPRATPLVGALVRTDERFLHSVRLPPLVYDSQSSTSVSTTGSLADDRAETIELAERVPLAASTAGPRSREATVVAESGPIARYVGHLRKYTAPGEQQRSFLALMPECCG